MRTIVVEDKQIERLSDSLKLLRGCAGWTAENLAKMIGTTRQTINAIENRKTKMSVMNYLAIRYVLDKEIQANPEGTEMLKSILDAFVDNYDSYDPEAREILRKNAELLYPAIITSDETKRNKTKKEASKIWVSIVTPLLGGLAVGAIVAAILKRK